MRDMAVLCPMKNVSGLDHSLIFGSTTKLFGTWGEGNNWFDDKEFSFSKAMSLWNIVKTYCPGVVFYSAGFCCRAALNFTVSGSNNLIPVENSRDMSLKVVICFPVRRTRRYIREISLKHRKIPFPNVAARFYTAVSGSFLMSGFIPAVHHNLQRRITILAPHCRLYLPKKLTLCGITKSQINHPHSNKYLRRKS